MDLAAPTADETIAALVAIGFRPRLPVDASGFADASTRARWIEQKRMTVLSMWDPEDPLRSVDLFVENPIDFEELWANADALDLGTTFANVASIGDPAPS